MKNILKLSFMYIVAAVLLMSCAPGQGIARTEAAVQDEGPQISFSVFYQSLRPYGRWISYPQYGQVWIPDAGAGFQPYSSDGHWVYSDYGWTWVSDYSWGWAPFHYGRWLFDGHYGWVWIPGQEWAPAWVAWRNSSDYYGWAPLGPGININININIPATRWVFVARNYFGSRDAYRYYVPRQQNVTIIHNTTIIRNVNVYQNNRYYTGPSRQEVQSATNRTIRPVRVFNTGQPGETRVSNRQLNIYRPQVVRSTDNRITPATNSHAAESNTGINRPQRISPAQNQQNPNTPSQVGNNSPARNVSPVKRTTEGNHAPLPVENKQVPAPTSPQRSPNRTMQRPTPSTQHTTREHSPAQKPKQPANIHRASVGSRPASVQTRQVSQERRQNIPGNKARPAEKDNNSSRPHRR